LIAGDEGAFKQIYFLYSERLYGNLIKLVKSEQVAQEVLQDVFMKIWDHRHSIDLDKSFRSYLFRIAENAVYDLYRKASRDKALLRQLIAKSATQYSHIEEAIFSKEQEHFLQHAIASLPPQRKRVFELCKIEGKSYEEVSRILGISVATISDHIVKANRFLKKYGTKNKELIVPLFVIIACLSNK